MALADDLTVSELFHALKQRLSGISSNHTSHTPGLDLHEAVSLQKEASDLLSLVKGLRNRSVPVGRLPGDVLEYIVTMRVLEQDILAASHVCRYWRAILTSSPRFWTNIRCTDVARTLQYLVRSEPVPINVSTDFYSDVRAVVALKSATSRLGSLTLRLRPFDLSKVFGQLATPAPGLERFEVYATPHFGDGRTSHPAIPTTFLGGSAPALKSLHLSGINTTLNFSEFPALTRLTLITNAHIFDMSELFWVFTSASLLEEVSVEFSGPTTPIPESQNVVQLVRIRKLGFSNMVGGFPERLLSLLDMPSVQEVKLNIKLPGDDTRTIRDFLPSRLQHPPQLSKVDSLKLDVPYARCNVQLRGPSGVVAINASRRGSRGQNDGFQSHWLGFLGPFSIADVKELTLRSYYPKESLDKCPVYKLLRTLDGLRSLVVERCDTAIVIEALSSIGKEGVLFPHLESLAFQHITEPTALFPGLTGMARARSQAGLPLRKVSSDQNATFRHLDVEALQHHVDSVHLNTEEDSGSSEPVRIAPSKTVTNARTPRRQTTGYAPAGGLPSANKENNPLSDLAAMYSRG